jgi:nitroimidazol reductase NimA-like FMN-containing flavoprotein (pyridoxamine 5'-phosphate oxidase superfamily)/predicted enzyme related to lactoylglutathione lyase
VRLVSTRPNVPDHLRVRRKAERGVYDRATIDAILDEALYCHVGFVADGRPVVIPTLHARVGDRLYLHGSSANRMLRTAAAGGRVCVTATLVDGLVLAKSVFHHSINYRSAVVMGVAAVVEGDEKREALRAFTEHVAPGRWEEARQPTESELVQTSILSLPLDEASAKVREGPPGDEPEDADLDVWSGVVPLHLAAEESEYDWARVRDGRLGAPGQPSVFRPGGVSYLRIPAPDPPRLAAFYAVVFGWNLRGDPERPSFDDGSGHVIGHFVPDVPLSEEGGFRPYVYVASVGETIAAALDAGGEVETQPYPEGDLTVAVLRDPAGNLVGVWQRS